MLLKARVWFNSLSNEQKYNHTSTDAYLILLCFHSNYKYLTVVLLQILLHSSFLTVDAGCFMEGKSLCRKYQQIALRSSEVQADLFIKLTYIIA